MSVGASSRLYFGKTFETSLGTAATLNLSFLGKLDFGAQHSDEVDDQVNGTIFEQSVTRTNLKAAGTFEAWATSNILAFLVKSLMMARPTTTGAGDPYTHTWTDLGTGSPVTGGINETGTASVTMVAQIAKIASYIDRFVGVFVKSITLSWSQTGKVTVSADLEGMGTIAATTEPSVTLPTEGYYIGAKTTLSIGGSAVGNRVESGSLKLMNGRSFLPRCGSTSGEASSLDVTDRWTAELDVTLNEGAVSEAGGHDDYATPVNRAVILVLKGDTNRDTTITLSTMRLMDSYKLGINSQGVYTVQRKYRSLYDAAQVPDFITVAVRNDVALYT